MRKKNSSRENIWKVNFRHGLYKTKVHTAWQSMLNRCENPRADKYAYYGGRGITVAAEWHTFEDFLKDMGQPPSKAHSLDRIDFNGNYCKENCRWADRETQSRNRRNIPKLTIDGVTKTVADWARDSGVSKWRINKRIKLGDAAALKALCKP